MYRDSTIPPIIPPLEDEMTLKRGDKGKAVGIYQRALMEWDPTALPRFKDDEDFGGETETWVKMFQDHHELDQTGVIDGVTADLLPTHKEAL
jgi:hypothetical protein